MKHLKITFILFCTILSATTICAQEPNADKPSLMYILEGEEISEAEVQKLIKEGRLKEMQKGISEKKRKAIIQKYGNKAKNSFIAIIKVFSNAEMLERKKKANKEPVHQTKDESTLIHVGDTPPDFTVEMLDGRKIKLSALKGKVVLLNFWATWCPPCMHEFMVIPEKILKPFEGEDFVFLPISRQEKREIVTKKMMQLKEKGIGFPVGLDPERKIYSLYAKQNIPRNFLINKEGKVVYASIGYNEKEFEKLITKIEEHLK